MSTLESPAPATAFPSSVAVRAAHNALLQQRRERGMDNETAAAAVQLIERGRATGALIDDDDERSDIQSLLNFWANVLYRAGGEAPDATLEEFDPSLAPELDDSLCPYLGLDTFREESHDRFFGRQQLIAELVERVGSQRLLAVVGPSGSGKSSLVRAGLIPALKAGALPGSNHWHYLLPFVPGSDPFAALARILPPPPNGTHWPAEQITALHADPTSLLHLLDQGSGSGDWGLGTGDLEGYSHSPLPTPHSPLPTLLIIDQFEEVFTLCDDQATREAFLAALLALVAAPGRQHRVILTLRSDFETFVARVPALHERVAAGRVQVTPLSAAELRDAIERPAEQVGLRFEAGVVERLLHDILGEPAALPLLQFTLLRLWEERERNRVTLAAYERVGGGRAALARSADALYNSLIPEDQVTARRILLRLVRPGSGLEITSSRVRRAALDAGGEDPGRVQRVLDRLLAARLLRLTPGDQPADDQIEVAHEALVRNWPTLVDWLEEERVAIANRRKLEARAVEWVQMGRGDAGLLDEQALQEAERWLGSGEAANLGYDANLPAFVAASRAAIERARQQQIAQEVELARAQATAEAEHLRAEEQIRASKRLRVQRIVLGVLLGLALIATAIAFRATADAEMARRAAVRLGDEAQRQRELADTAKENAERQLVLADSQRLAIQALNLAYSAPETALLLAYEAVAHDRNQVSEQALRQVFEQVPWRSTTVLPVSDDSARSASFSPDGQLILTLGRGQPPQLWNRSGLLQTTLQGHTGDVSVAAWSLDGQQVVTGGKDRTARLWNRSGAPLATFQPHEHEVSAAAVSPDGRTVATGEVSGTVRLWQTDGPLLATLSGHSAKIEQISWSPDGQFVTTASQDGTARLWNLQGQQVALFGHEGEVATAIFDQAGQRVLTASFDGTARLWDLTGAQLVAFEGHSDRVTSAAFNHNGQWVLTGSDDYTARVWSLDGTEIQILHGHNDDVARVAWSPDDQLILTGSDDNSAIIWSRSGTLLAVLNGHTDDVIAASFSADGTQVLTASEDGTARIWGIVGQLLTDRADGETAAWSTLFSPISPVVLSLTGGDTARLLDKEGAVVQTFRGHSDVVVLATFSPDGKQVLTASLDGTARLWDPQSGASLAMLTGGEAVMTALAFSPDGQQIAIGDAGGDIRLWGADGSPGAQLTGHTGTIFSVVFSPDGQRLLSASADGTARLWDTSGRELRQFAGRDNGSWNATFSPDGRTLLTFTRENVALLWDLDGKLLATFAGHEDDLSTVAFSPDGTLVLTASDDNTAALWDLTGKRLALFEGHTGPVRGAIFSPDGQRVLTSSDDDTTSLWDLKGTLITTFIGIVPTMDQRAFSSDGRRIVTSSGGATVHQYLLVIDDLLREASCRIGRNLTDAEKQRFAISWQPAFEVTARQCTLETN